MDGLYQKFTQKVGRPGPPRFRRPCCIILLGILESKKGAKFGNFQANLVEFLVQDLQLITNSILVWLYNLV